MLKNLKPTCKKTFMSQTVAKSVPVQERMEEAGNEAIILEAMVCPITHEIMDNPVVADDGHSHSRAAIEAWFRANRTSSLTNVVLESTRLSTAQP